MKFSRHGKRRFRLLYGKNYERKVCLMRLRLFQPSRYKMELSNKVVLIIGGAAGIGAATVVECAARGASVVVADMNVTDGEAVAKAVGGTFVEVNVTRPESVQRMYQHVEDRHGHLDVLLHTAGIMQGAHVPLAEFSLDTFNTVLNVNVVGSFLCAKHALPLMKKEGKGVIVLV